MKKFYAALVYLFLFLGMPYASQAQALEPNSGAKPSGVSVTPSTVWFNAKPGTTQTKEIRIKNDTERSYKFSVNFSDYEMDNNGKVTFLDAGTGNYSFFRWATVAPTFIELKPGESAKVKVSIDVPFDDNGEKSAWSIMMIDEIKERTELVTEANNAVAFGVNAVFAIGVYLYQNPPNVNLAQTEITELACIDNSKGSKTVKVKAKNNGDGVSFCKTYLELTHLKTGEVTRLTRKNFIILPTYIRDFSYDLPDNLKSGDYSLLVVLDFGSEEEVEAAEIEFKIP
ncbi:MAG: hypothetical protein ACXITV_06500 [Luteibaculaceae bacterium]